ncbi:MAG: hypothetical protein HYS06_02770 [Methylocystis sp.]|nr:hypothetical protein [Methylocystis sp.]
MSQLLCAGPGETGEAADATTLGLARAHSINHSEGKGFEAGVFEARDLGGEPNADFHARDVVFVCPAL